MQRVAGVGRGVAAGESGAVEAVEGMIKEGDGGTQGVLAMYARLFPGEESAGAAGRVENPLVGRLEGGSGGGLAEAGASCVGGGVGVEVADNSVVAPGSDSGLGLSVRGDGAVEGGEGDGVVRGDKPWRGARVDVVHGEGGGVKGGALVASAGVPEGADEGLENRRVRGKWDGTGEGMKNDDSSGGRGRDSRAGVVGRDGAGGRETGARTVHKAAASGAQKTSMAGEGEVRGPKRSSAAARKGREWCMSWREDEIQCLAVPFRLPVCPPARPVSLSVDWLVCQSGGWPIRWPASTAEHPSTSAIVHMPAFHFVCNTTWPRALLRVPNPFSTGSLTVCTIYRASCPSAAPLYRATSAPDSLPDPERTHPQHSGPQMTHRVSPQTWPPCCGTPTCCWVLQPGVLLTD